MGKNRAFFSEANLNGQPLAAYRKAPASIQDRYLLKDYLEYVHIQKGLLEPYYPAYPLIEPRELLPSFEKTFAEFKHLPSFSMVAFNRPLSYQDEIFQFDLLHPLLEGKKRTGRENLDKILPHLDRDLRPKCKQRFSGLDLTDLLHMRMRPCDEGHGGLRGPAVNLVTVRRFAFYRHNDRDLF